ncbi:MAG: hypothetical protein B9J98_07885 [Candidatus Terraquivivens tikiterensis]|uniref:Uncharacterized protein n=1 Tax=Candidatus Terraquivivens tikiterensis TaxID=1980982 RepID=A0A2R7Y0U7_9ARCH|nr:MAG: hypothetical protein B9J98_07885 [Candidatus Terraquivivens tikiterensis]
MSEEEISLAPVGRQQIHRLESALLLGTLFRPEVLEALRNPEERLTWVDSLAVAAAAIARERAKMTVSQIAEELGRAEQTIRNHIQGKTKAGHFVKETLQRFMKEGVKIQLPASIFSEASAQTLAEVPADAERLKQESERLRQEVESLRSLLEEEQRARRKVEEELAGLKEVITNVRRMLEAALNQLP